MVGPFVKFLVATVLLMGALVAMQIFVLLRLSIEPTGVQHVRTAESK